MEPARELAEHRASRPGGRFQVHGDEGGSATALGQWVYFAESLDVTGLFERWQTARVKRLIERLWSRHDWQAVGHGFDAVAAELKLAGRRRARRVVVLRRRVKGPRLAEVTAQGQQTLLFADADPAASD